MRTGGDFHKDLKRELGSAQPKNLFEKEKTKLKLADKLRTALQQSKLSVRKVAHQMGTSKSQVDRIVNNPKANISLDTLIKFALAIGRKVEVNLK